jgi:N-ethylmaleimide reductase
MTMTDLFTPFDLRGMTLPNRILLSAMTRTRATEDHVPTEVMRDYFVQRVGAGLMLTDCTSVSMQGNGVIRGPGIYNEAQIDGWRMITDAVHHAGGRIYCQIWHCGRVAHPDMRGGEMPVAPSAIPAVGDFFLPNGRVDFPVPRELSIDEIPAIVTDFAKATKAAQDAGFDGVELHGANGYLQDQFLQDVSNKRTDSYGGAAENRARLMLETVDAMIAAWTAERIGVRLSPSSSLYGMGDSDPLSTFGHLVHELDARHVGYITMLEPNAKEKEKRVKIDDVAGTFRPMTSVPFITNTGYDKVKGNTVIADGKADLVAFGVPYIANPDLAERFKADAELNKPNPALFYGVGAEGYTDYPVMAESVAP